MKTLSKDLNTISPKKTHKWPRSTGEDAQHHHSLVNNNEMPLHTHQCGYDQREENQCW